MASWDYPSCLAGLPWFNSYFKAREHLLHYALAADMKQVHLSIVLNMQQLKENHHLNVVFPHELCIIPKTL